MHNILFRNEGFDPVSKLYHFPIVQLLKLLNSLSKLPHWLVGVIII